MDNKPKSGHDFIARQLIAQVGIKRIFDEVGIEKLIETVGVGPIIHALTNDPISQLIIQVGIKRIIDEVGVDPFIQALQAKLPPEQFQELKQKLDRRTTPLGSSNN